MKAIKEHGECIINYGDKSYFFRPSFQAMNDLGDPDEIVQKFADIHDDSTVKMITALTDTCSGRLPEWSIDYFNRYGGVKTALLAAMDVMIACCEEDITPLIGEIKPSKRAGKLWVWNRGAMESHEIVIIASNLMQHGVIGKAKVRVPMRNETGKTTSKFRAVEYINAARSHFGISREEAASLTMTEFCLMLNAKYPPQAGLTREEYDAGKEEAKRLRRARIEAERIKKERANV